MDRYGDLDLDCDGGGVTQKAALFGGMFKKSSKSTEPFDQAQIFCADKSSDSLADNNTKDKGGVFKGIFKKTLKSSKEEQAQASHSLQNPELSASSDSLTDNNKSSKEKSGVLGGIRKWGHVRRPSQDLLDDKLSASDDSLSENANTKESGGVFGGMFKKSPKLFGARTQSQDDLSAPAEFNGNTKESGGVFSGMFKKSPKPPREKTEFQDDVSVSKSLSGSSDSLSENNTKEKGGLLSGVFRKKGAKSQSQDDLSVEGELFVSADNLTEKSSKGGVAAKLLKNPFASSSQEKDKAEHSGDSHESSSSTDKPKVKQSGFSAMMKNTFSTDRQQEKNADTDGEETLDNGEGQPSHKQNKLAGAMTKLNPFRSANKSEKQTGFDDEDPPAYSDKSSGNKQNAMIGAMTKLNPFRSANKKDPEDTETLKENDKQVEEKPKPVKRNMIQQERKEKGETPFVPARPTEEEIKRTSTYDKVKLRGTDDNQDKKDILSREKKEKPAETPAVPPRPSEEEINRGATRALQKKNNHQQGQSDDEGPKEDESTEAKKGDKMKPPESKTTKKKHKHNPFMPRAAAKAASDDEKLKDDDESKEEKNDEEGKSKGEETKVKKPKRHNPFMLQIKTKAIRRPTEDDAAGNSAENEGGNRSLFDQLEDLRINSAQPEDDQELDLMEWWKTVEPWENTPQDDDMTEKEEAKAFALTAEKVQKGIRVFNKLFSERAESLWQHVIDLNSIADGLDKFNKNTKIAQITGGSTSAIGGVATITGLALAPVTLGTSLIVTAVGLGVAAAGGLTSAGAGISNQVNNSMDRKKVERIVDDYQEKILDLNKCLKFIKQGIENLRKFDLLKMKNHTYNRDFPALTSSFYEDGAMAGKAILINANEIMRVVQIANVAGSTAARAVQIASMTTGVLTGLFVGMDIYFVAKDSKELKKGAKSEFAAKIREVATQLHDGLVELNGIREELQSTTGGSDGNTDSADLDDDKKEKDDKYDDDSEEDEIERIKKAIKKDIESREYV